MGREYGDILNGTFGDEQMPRTGRDLSVIFGSGIRLSDDNNGRGQRRIVVYPCESSAETFNVAQGLMCALTWALNDLNNVVVMPLLVADPVNPSPADHFTPDEFSLDELGEDTIITAQYSIINGQHHLRLLATTEIENAEDLKLNITGESYAALLNALLKSAVKFAVWLNGYESDVISFQPIVSDDTKLKTWLETAFSLHVALLRDAANEVGFDFEKGAESPFYAEFSALRDQTIEINHDAMSWLMIQGASLASAWFEEIDPEGFIEAVKALGKWHFAAPAVSRALIDMEDIRLALDTMETAVAEAPDIPLNWLVLARLYLAAQRPDLLLSTVQTALEKHNSYAPLLVLYGEVSLNYANQGLTHGHSIQPEGAAASGMASEAAAAFKAAAELTSGDQRNMSYVQLITALVQVDGADIWPVLSRLAVSDAAGIYTEIAVGVSAAQDDIENAISGLQAATVKFPEVGQVWRNLAYVQYLSGDESGAKSSVDQALKYAENAKARGDYELLALYTQDNKLEGQFADIADFINAGATISERNLEFLEWIVGEAPHYAEGYLLLARAYIAEGEGDTALEVLLDAEKNVGIEAEIVVSIVDLLRESDEETVALDYVTKGLEAFPRDIQLLARAAQVTHALGDEDSARSFLRQAHNIAPYHRELIRVTREIMESDQEN